MHQKTVDQVTSFFRPDSPQHSLIGLAILIRLIDGVLFFFCSHSHFSRECTSEINVASPTITLTQHRRIAIAFRDSALLKIFKLSLTTLRAIDSGNISDAEKDVAEDIRSEG